MSTTDGAITFDGMTISLSPSIGNQDLHTSWMIRWLKTA